MKVQKSIFLIGVILVLFSLQVTGYLNPIMDTLSSAPWWVYLILVGILFSGFQYFRISREEEEIDQEFIENEGKIYIERMEKERATRRGNNTRVG